MKMPMSWLKDYIDPNVSMRDYSEDLTMSGSKVEGFETQGEEITNVITGEVLSIEPHPDAEKLVVCQINVAGDEPIQIVTGAKNLTVGDIVPIAMHKSTLSGGLKITRGNLRGVKSNGMMCSYQELGLDHSYVPYACEDGILVLPKGTQIGACIKEVLGFNDTVVEFEITSNRPDCMSILGLARETFATYGKNFTMPQITVKGENDDINNHLKVEVKTDLCNRYTAKMVKNVKIEPSPEWMRKRLNACGIRPINNIVDITNYVLLEYGQPMHAFDYSTIEGNKIVVDMAQNDEKFTTLDDQERVLDNSMIVIKDGKKTSALGGIMGGLNSEIKDNTTTLVFESANFDGATIRVASKKLGLRTESSGKFEKGLDPENAMNAILRACELVEELGAGEVCGGIIDIYNNKPETITIPLNADKINTFLGTAITKTEMIEILERLGFSVSSDVITVPSFRTDVTMMADIAEEIARIYGYNNIKSTSFAGQTVCGGLTSVQTFENSIGRNIRALGFDEIITYSFISKSNYDKINLPEEQRISTVITNPLGEDLSIMRTTTLPSMLDAVTRNINYQNKLGNLYEIGKIYLPVVANGIVDATKLPEEKKIITLSTFGNNEFFAFKGKIETLLANLGVSNVVFKAETTNQTYHTGRCANIYVNDEKIGIFGNIHPEVVKNYGVNAEILMCELDFNSILQNKETKVLYKKLPKFPASTRDISFICDANIPVFELETTIRSSVSKILENVKLFDVFVNEKIGENKKSVAYSLTFRVSDRTLTDEECDNAVASILKNLEKDFGATLRL